MTKNAYVVSWCSEGLEAIVPITQYEHEDDDNLLEMIKTGKPHGKSKLGPILHMLTLRARFNPHRHYEIYALDCDENITEQDIASMFEGNPNAAAETIRSKGVCIVSQRRAKQDLIY